jgi:hypothetical protein
MNIIAVTEKMQVRSKLPPPEWNMARIEGMQGMKKTETTILTNIAISDVTDLSIYDSFI